MNTKHYYARYTPMGNDGIWGDMCEIPGAVVMFDNKRVRDEWVEDNEFNTYNGKGHQTMTLTEREARVIMLRQCGREMADYHKNHGLYTTFREYARFCPTWLMFDDYSAVSLRVLGFVFAYE